MSDQSSRTSGGKPSVPGKYNVCFSANDAYRQHLTVACLSLLVTNPVPWDIYLVTTDFRPQSERRLRRMVERRGSRLHRITMDDSKFRDLPIEYSRFDVHTYFRLYLGRLLPETVGNLLYLDSDLVVDGPLTDLFDRPARAPLEAVRDYGMDADRLALRGNNRYFNAGVMYIPLAHWRREQYHGKLLSHVPPTYEYADQEILNDFFKGQWHELSWRYNTFHFFLYRFPAPSVIHYAGDHKPWRYLTLSGITYWKYLLRSPYRLRAWTVLQTIRPGIGLFLYYKKQRVYFNRLLAFLRIRKFELPEADGIPAEWLQGSEPAPDGNRPRTSGDQPVMTGEGGNR